MITLTYIDPSSNVHTCELRDPDWITDYTKIHNVTVRRAMSGKIRTYVVRDRKYAHAITYNMRFILHRPDVQRVKKFLALCDGHYVWTRGTDSNVSAFISQNADPGDRSIKLKTVTGSINVGDFVGIKTGYYTILGASDSGIIINPGLAENGDVDDPVTVFKQQMVIITNQQFDFGSDSRAAGDDDDTGEIVEDETYSLTLAILVIKT